MAQQAPAPQQYCNTYRHKHMYMYAHIHTLYVIKSCPYNIIYIAFILIYHIISIYPQFYILLACSSLSYHSFSCLVSYSDSCHISHLISYHNCIYVKHALFHKRSYTCILPKISYILPYISRKQHQIQRNRERGLIVTSCRLGRRKTSQTLLSSKTRNNPCSPM